MPTSPQSSPWEKCIARLAVEEIAVTLTAAERLRSVTLLAGLASHMVNALRVLTQTLTAGVALERITKRAQHQRSRNRNLRDLRTNRKEARLE